MRLYLVRHLSPMVAPGICYGRTDLAVDPAVLASALPALRAQLPAGAPVVSSPLRRCAALAACLSVNAVRHDARLAELDLGAWEMRRWDDIARGEIDAWAADVALHRPGGGESVADMAARIAAFYADMVRERGPDTIVVCHAGAMRLLAACGRGLAPVDMARRAADQPNAIAYGEVLVLECV